MIYINKGYLDSLLPYYLEDLVVSTWGLFGFPTPIFFGRFGCVNLGVPKYQKKILFIEAGQKYFLKEYVVAGTTFWCPLPTRHPEWLTLRHPMPLSFNVCLDPRTH